MNEIVFKGFKPQDVNGAFVDFVETMFPSLGGNAVIHENEYGKYMFADGTIFNQAELSDALIRYAWDHSLGNAIIVNSLLFGECGMLYYAMVKTMMEVYNKDRKLAHERFTYLMQDQLTKLIKIGSTCDLNNRLKTLTVGNPNLIIIAVLAKNIEAELHRKYKSRKVKREFYSLTEEDIASIIKEYGFEDKLMCVD